MSVWLCNFIFPFVISEPFVILIAHIAGNVAAKTNCISLCCVAPQIEVRANKWCAAVYERQVLDSISNWPTVNIDCQIDKCVDDRGFVNY